MKKALWFQKFGAIQLIGCLIKGSFSDFTVYYAKDEVSSIGRFVLTVLRKLKLDANMQPLVLPGDKKDTAGCSLFYNIYEEMEACMENFYKEFIPEDPDWFKTMSATYLLTFTSSPFHFITKIKEDIVKQKDKEHIVYISGYPISSLVKKFHSAENFKIKRIFSPKEYIFLTIRPFYMLLSVLLYQIIGIRVRTNIEKIIPSVWVEYEGQKNMLSFWHNFINANRFDLVYYFDRMDTPISEESRRNCRQDGFKWINLRKKNMARLNFEDMKEIVSTFINYKAGPYWLHIFRFHFAVLYRIYRSLFRHFQVKILIQHQNTSWIQQAQAMAIESAGGIMIGFPWTVAHVSLPFFLTPEHVYFVWGEFMSDYLKRKGHTCRYILPCGLWIIDRKTKQDTFFSKDINFVMAILDGSVDSNIYQTPDTLSQFYLFLFRLIEKKPSWGGIVKSKHRTLDELSLLPNGGELVSRAMELVEKKKVVFFSHYLSPSSAAAYSNLSVSYGIQTAGIVIGTHNYPSIMWDCAGWTRHPFYKYRDQKIVFSALDSLGQAINKAAQGDTTIGDFSRWRQAFNHFDDFNAPARVGQFIQTFMDEVIGTGNMKNSLEHSVSDYIKLNSINKFDRNGELSEKQESVCSEVM